MTTLPEKNLLSGKKLPRTTTGEMKEALGKLRDYLAELLGEDSSDKETARQALGIDLMQWAEKIEAKADPKDIESAVATKADKTELESSVLELEDAIAKRGIPVGSIEYFAMTIPPAGYLKANGAAVGRETYPELFAAIGTTFGEGDGTTTFNLPDLIDRFAQGSNTPGQKIEAGLPNITGETKYTRGDVYSWKLYDTNGAFCAGATTAGLYTNNVGVGSETNYLRFDASNSNPIYGASDTVQPPALTLLPCIKAFDAASHPGLIDITGLANDIAEKVDKVIDNKPVRYVIDAYNDGTNWYRKWSDGWVEQGGNGKAPSTLNFLLPFSNDYQAFATRTSGGYEYSVIVTSKTSLSCYVDIRAQGNVLTTGDFDFYACGQGV